MSFTVPHHPKNQPNMHGAVQLTFGILQVYLQNLQTQKNQQNLHGICVDVAPTIGETPQSLSCSLFALSISFDMISMFQAFVETVDITVITPKDKENPFFLPGPIS